MKEIERHDLRYLNLGTTSECKFTQYVNEVLLNIIAWNREVDAEEYKIHKHDTSMTKITKIYRHAQLNDAINFPKNESKLSK